MRRECWRQLLVVVVLGHQGLLGPCRQTRSLLLLLLLLLLLHLNHLHSRALQAKPHVLQHSLTKACISRHRQLLLQLLLIMGWSVQ